MTKHDNVSQEGIMKATEFVKNCGIGEAKRVLNDARGCVGVKLYGKYEFSTDDLKRLVESHELLKIIDLESPLIDELVNELIETGRPRLVELGKRIKQAIADVEACHEVN
ncbi:hypothetical protein [Acinetobacter radioresistens]|uniref:hypothetical protein n=2 Tax=Acinetobacter radioresistens TaxID=40216 RepID=UPI003A8121F0